MDTSSSSSSNPIVMIFGFIYENFTYILGTTVVIFGIIVYLNMAKISFDMPMTRSKKLVIETMDLGKNENDNITSSINNENTLLTPSIDLEKKLKSGFCNMHATKGSSATDIDNECKVFGKASCLNTDCCGWVVTANNPDGVCRSGSKTGMTFGYDKDGKKIDVDCYYYKDAKSGPRCSS